MGFRINTNVGAMNAHMHSVNNNRGLDKSLSALSSGLRINKAADDAAGLAIANKLAAQKDGLGQAIRNSNDGIAMLQTADGAMEEMGQIAKRIRTLAVQAANDTQDTQSRSYISKEITELATEFNQIIKSTTFNDKKLLDGSADNSNIQIGHKSSDTKALTLATNATLTATALTVNTVTNAQSLIDTMDTLIKDIDGKRADIGADQNSLESVIRNISVTQVNVAAAESNIRDVDFAQESATLQKHNILAQSGTYALSQANAAQQNVMTLLR
jgi:flagellin